MARCREFLRLMAGWWLGTDGRVQAELERAIGIFVIEVVTQDDAAAGPGPPAKDKKIVERTG